MTRRLLAPIALTIAAATFSLGGTPAVAASADQQIADQGIIVAGDIPGAWTPSSNDAADEKKSLKLAARTKGCADYTTFAKANLATTHAASDDFTSATDAQISNQSYVHADAAAATEALDALRSTTVPTCLSKVFTTALAAELKKDPAARKRIRDVELTMEPVNAALGSFPTVAYKGTVTIDLNSGATQTLNVALIAVQVDRVLLAYSIQAPPSGVTDLNTALNSAPLTTATRTSNAL